jgi:hypothetical protein
MQLPNLLTLIRKFASFLLALCFVLPLSQCDIKKTERESTVEKPVTFQGSDMAREGLIEIEAGKAEGAMTLLLVLCVFFLPMAALACGTRVQLVLHWAGSLLSGYVLYNWVFVLASRPLPGGLIACLGSALLFLTSSLEVSALWKDGQERTAQGT